MAKEETNFQDRLRGDGTIPVLSVESDYLAEATHNAIVSCYRNGRFIETPKQRPGMELGIDADMTIAVRNPDAEPKIYIPGIHDDGRGVLQYVLEVTNGIHNHGKKAPEHPGFWGYTYNERVVEQLPFVFARIKHDWEKTKGQWGDGVGRITGRDYQFTTWRPGEDIILEQDDPPCWQSGRLRFLRDSKGEIVMNYQTEWRSRDLLKAWNENNLGQIELMKLLKLKVSNLLDVPIKLGSYIDRSSSLHLYGLYFERDGLDDKICNMEEEGWEARSLDSKDYMTMQPDMDADLPWPATIEAQKRLIAAQMQREKETGTMNASRRELVNAGYDLEKFSYPAEWDTWPKSWDAEPNPELLARVVKK